MRLVGGDAGDAGGGGVCAVSMGKATRVGGSVDGGRCFGTRETIGVQNAHAITKEFLP